MLLVFPDWTKDQGQARVVLVKINLVLHQKLRAQNKSQCKDNKTFEMGNSSF